MNKSYYFQHDYNAAQDIKILFLRQQLGIEGYGIYWFILEQLAISGGSMPMKIIPVIAMQIQTPADKVYAVIKNYELFTITEDDSFFSPRLLEQLEYRKFLSESGKNGAQLRWKNRGAIKDAINTPKAKERKESKVNEINTPNGVVPTTSIPPISKNEIKSLWNGFLKNFELIGEGLTETEKQTKQRTDLKKFIEGNSPDFIDPYFVAYRLFAFRMGLPIPSSITSSRKAKFKVRIKEPAFDFYKILEAIHKSKFCRGENNRNWRVDFDWILENDTNYIKLIEQKFD